MMQITLVLKKLGTFILWTVGILVSICLLIILFGAYYLRVYPLDNTKFNQEVWNFASKSKGDWEQFRKDEQCIKGGMVGDLKRRYLKRGITNKSEVISLLGKPYSTDTGEFLQCHTCLEYDIGYCLGFRIDPNTLYICFDKNDKLKRVYP